MIKEFVEAWEKNKSQLEEYFKTHKQGEYDSYTKLVKLLFDIVINPTIGNVNGPWSDINKFDTDDIHIINDGNDQGTLIFILHRKYYRPSIREYVFTSVHYGSCSGCDALLGINPDSDHDMLPTENQLNDYMILCLHLLQKCKFMMDSKEGE